MWLGSQASSCLWLEDSHPLEVRARGGARRAAARSAGAEAMWTLPGAGQGSPGPLSCSWVGLPTAAGGTRQSQLVHAQVLLVFLCFYFLS